MLFSQQNDNQHERTGLKGMKVRKIFFDEVCFLGNDGGVGNLIP
jgi:hypothetical protein